MTKNIVILVCLILLSSCGSSKKTGVKKNNSGIAVIDASAKPTIKSSSGNTISIPNIPAKDEDAVLYKIATHAMQFEGTRYKFGGTTSKGMDCSGLVYVAYQKENIQLPRISRDMATQGKRISTKNVTIGDLLFFKTNRKSNRINHVGLVVDVLPGQVLFIHSTSSRGVIVSSLNEGYWNNAYVEARRII